MNLDLLRRVQRVLRDAERGVSAVILALSMTVMMGAAAVGFDIAKLYYEKQMVRNAVDAAAQVGAAQLPTDGTTSGQAALISAIQRMVNINYPAIPASGTTAAMVKLYCVVANASGSATDPSPDTTQFSPSGCNPGTNYTAQQVKCSASSCAVPCDDATDRCNAVMVQATKQVDFVFAPAINISSGTTGAVTTVSCKGSCGGQAAPNPMNVVVMADRTPSMQDGNAPTGSFNGLKSGIKSMLQVMDPAQQYVAFGAIHKSLPKVSSGNLGSPPTSSDNLYTYTTTTTTTTQTKWVCTGTYWNYTCGWVETPVTITTSERDDRFNGVWIPVNFSNNYNNGQSTLPRPLTTSTDLYKTVDGLTFSSGGRFDDVTNNGIGTHLASALKGAARYLLKPSLNNIAELDASGTRKDLGTPKNVIIFETDGRPEEIFNSADLGTALSFDNDLDIGNQNGETACDNLKKVAKAAKDAGILIITIGFGNAAKYTCAKSGGDGLANSGSMYVDDVLASVASANNGVASKADRNCSDTSSGGGKDQENADGDNFYCAANGDDLRTVFSAALGSLTGGTKYMAIDGLSD